MLRSFKIFNSKILGKGFDTAGNSTLIFVTRLSLRIKSFTEAKKPFTEEHVRLITSALHQPRNPLSGVRDHNGDIACKVSASIAVPTGLVALVQFLTPMLICRSVVLFQSYTARR